VGQDERVEGVGEGKHQVKIGVMHWST
jgi:hypothetical protein